MRATPLTLRLVLLLSIPPLMWAGNAVVGRMLVGQAPPLALNALRWVSALLMLLPLGWQVLRQPAEIALRWRHLAVLALVGVGSYNALQYMAVQTSTPLNITLIAASSPVWMLLIGALFHGVRPRAAQIAGAALSLAGVMMVLSRGSLAALASVSLVPGDLLMLVAVAAWAAYSWMLARPPASMAGAARPSWNWAEFLLLQVIFGLGWATLAAGAEAVIHPAPIVWSWGLVLALVFLGIGPSILSYYCWAKGVAEVGPGHGCLLRQPDPGVCRAAVSAAAGAGAAVVPWCGVRLDCRWHRGHSAVVHPLRRHAVLRRCPGRHRRPSASSAR